MLFLASCNTAPPVTYSATSTGAEPMVKVYYATYDYTWQTTLKEMQRFNLKVVNKDSGVIITDDTVGYSGDLIRSQFRYYFEIQLIALPMSNGVPQTQISVTKFIYKTGGLFPERPVKSDLIDERVILYRVKRLLEIERAKLERAGNKSS